MGPQTTAPTDLASLNRYLSDAASALRDRDVERAMRVADEAASLGLLHPNLLTLAVHRRLGVGDAERALVWATRARELAPESPDVLNALGLVLARLGRLREACETYEAGARGAKGFAPLHLNLALALEELGEIGRAAKEFETTVALDPGSAEAYSHLAHLAAQRGDARPARDYALRALALDPGQHAAAIALAMAELSQGADGEAENRLRQICDDAVATPVNRALATTLLGDIFDSRRQYRLAFQFYAKGKAVLREHVSARYSTGETPLALLERLNEYFGALSPGGWKYGTLPAAEADAGHVFLVGFPRSGTTLLEQVLASHSEVESLEERDCLIDATDQFFRSKATLDSLASADERTLEKYREAYWARVAETAHPRVKRVFLDKLPLNTVALSVIAKLFPKARILFAVRDPRDVVFSCFRRQFGINRQMFEFTTLEGTARYYDAVMTLAENYERTLALDLCLTRHEALVSGFDAEVARICDFLNISPEAEMRGFAAHARERGIGTPSAAQVARGLFTQGIGQWRNYAEDLGPVLPVLGKWVDQFDYRDDT